MRNLLTILIVLTLEASAWGAAPAVASLVVAPFDASDKAKAKADFVCDGQDDQEELLESVNQAKVYRSRSAGAPNNMRQHEWHGRHSAIWLPGTYQLSQTLEFPELSDFALYAEGTYLVYQPTAGDVVQINRSIRSRFNFGTINSHSTGACIRVTGMTMSVIRATGLIGYDQQGVGLRIFGTSTSKYEITDVSGFDTGILVDDVGNKVDTNWFWISYVRNCQTCIWEKGKNVDNNVWQVNVDATLPRSVALRIAGDMGNWHVIMGTFQFEGKNQALILEPGAEGNVIFMQPPLERFAATNRSGNNTNVVMSTPRYQELLQLLEQAQQRN